MSWLRWTLAAGIALSALATSPQAAAQLLGLTHERTTGTLQVVSADANTGNLTPIGTGLAGCCRLGLGATALDAAGQNIYAVGPDPLSPSGALQLVQYSAGSGTGTVVGLLGSSDRVVGLDYEGTSSRLIALLSNSAGDLQLVSINTATGAATGINSGLANCCVLEPGLATLADGNMLVVARLRTDSSDTRTLYAFSTSGSNAVTSTPLPAGTNLAALVSASGSAPIYALKQSFTVPRIAGLQLVQVQPGIGLSAIGAPTTVCCAVAIDTATIDGGALRVVAHDPATPGLSILSFSLATGVSSFSATALPASRIVDGLFGIAAVPPGVTVAESGGSTAVTEGGATDTYSLVLTAAPSSDVTITVSPDAQLSVAPSTLTFTTGNWASPQIITVTAVDDGLTEGAHSGTITHSASGGGYSAVSIASVTASITDNDSASLAISDVSAAEGNAGSTNFTFNVTFTGNVAGAFTVPVSSLDGTAMAGSDYTAIPGGTLLNFTGASGQVQPVTVSVQGDTIVEANEGFTVTLGAPSNPLITLSDGSGAGGIINDDSANVAIDSLIQAEGDSGSSTFTFTVTLTGDVQDGFTLPYQTTDGTALAGSDYTAASGTLSFTGSNGQTRNILVAVAGDTTVEADEDFFVDLGAASAAGVSVSPSRGTATVINDDLYADIAVSNSNGVSTLAPGDSTTYTVVVSNTSTLVDVPAVDIVQTLSVALTGVSWTCAGSGGATCPAANGTGAITTTLALAKGASVTYLVSATVAPNELDTIDATVTATAQSPYGDQNPANNSVTDSDPRVWDSFANGFE
jgi:hypothetical protein